MFKGFREFIERGNVMDLAVAVVIGAAFNSIVDKVVDALIYPIVGMVFNAESLDSALTLTLPGGGVLGFGAILGAIINFLIIAAAVYFLFVAPMNKLKGPRQEEETGPTETELLTEIRDLLKKQNS